MKIELEVDPGKVGQSLTDILGSLTPDERRALATAAMTEWLKEPIDTERIARERWAIEEVKKRSASDYDVIRTDEAARKSYRFQDIMNQWKSSKEKMVEMVTAEIVSFYKEEVKRVVESDPRVLEMRAQVTKIMLETFPKIAHDAMTIFVAQNFQNMLAETSMLQVRINQMGLDTKNVADRLTQVARQMGMT